MDRRKDKPKQYQLFQSQGHKNEHFQIINITMHNDGTRRDICFALKRNEI